MSPSDALRIAQQVIDEDGKHSLSRRNLTHLAKAARDALSALAASHDRALAAEAQLAAVMPVVEAEREALEWASDMLANCTPLEPRHLRLKAAAAIAKLLTLAASKAGLCAAYGLGYRTHAQDMFPGVHDAEKWRPGCGRDARSE